jgi:ketosteroid isomerase-like protein
MPLPNSHVELAHHVWDATAFFNDTATTEIYTPDVVLRVRGGNPLCGEFKGDAALLGQFARWAELVDDLCSDLLEIFSSEDGALLRYRVQATRGEQHLDQHLDAEFHLSFRVAGGRIYEVEIVAKDAERTDAFWNSVAA